MEGQLSISMYQTAGLSPHRDHHAHGLRRTLWCPETGLCPVFVEPVVHEMGPTLEEPTLCNNPYGMKIALRMRYSQTPYNPYL
jgi:hypothetical protein